jgi:hypothetical protein
MIFHGDFHIFSYVISQFSNRIKIADFLRKLIVQFTGLFCLDFMYGYFKNAFFPASSSA